MQKNIEFLDKKIFVLLYFVDGGLVAHWAGVALFQPHEDARLVKKVGTVVELANLGTLFKVPVAN